MFNFDDPDGMKFLILGGVTVSVWVMSRLVEVSSSIWTRWQARKAYLRALFAEIDFNTHDLEIFVRQTPDMEMMRRRLAEPAFIPHITDARHTEIYRNQITLLHALDDDLIREVVTFYGTLEKIRVIIDGLLQPSYKSISEVGQYNVIENLYATCDACSGQGAEILRQMTRRYTQLDLVRHKRGEFEAGTWRRPMDERLKTLSSDLDRIRSAHGKTPV